MTFEFVGIGDLHLTDDRGSGGLAKYIDDPNGYVMREVQRVIDWARERHVTHAILYGDICENPRMSYEGQLALIKTIEANSDINWWMILGNHDKVGAASSMGHSMQIIMKARLPNLKIFTKDRTVEIEGVKVKFCPWPSTSFDPSALNIGHIEVKGSKSDSGRTMDSDELSISKAVVMMGHLHTRHRVRNTYYSGTLYQTNFGEQPKKYFHHVVFTSPEDYEVIAVPFDSEYKLHNIVIETQADVDAMPRGEKDLLKVVVKDGSEVIVPDLPNIVINKAFKTKAELQTILTEDLLQGSELVVRSEDFFAHWLANRDMEGPAKARTLQLRKEILSGNANTVTNSRSD